jgi:O-antigen/teichoic acid export membrane protein
LLAPILTTIDRLLIGSVLSMDAVAFYTVPFNLVTRISVLPGALSNSLFPKLSRQSRLESRASAHEAVMALAAVMTPLIVAGILALPIFMRVWLGAGFASRATSVGMIFLVGIWVNGLAYIPFGLLQANNRPDVTAKFHALELLPFLAILWIGLHYFGLIGAACAWTLRVVADALLLFLGAGQVGGWLKLAPGMAIIMIAPFCAPQAMMSWQSVCAMGLLLAASLWALQVSPQMRRLATKYFGQMILPRPA